MKAFVTGVAGQLGHDIMNELAKRGYEAVGSDVRQGEGVSVTLDITDKNAVMGTLTAIKPDVVFHCAAWTAVDMAEDEDKKDLVFKIRESIPNNLVCVIGTTGGNKPLLSVMLSEDMVKEHGLNAGQMVREAAKLIQGGGGGQPHYASAGGKNIDGLNAAIDKVIELANL